MEEKIELESTKKRRTTKSPTTFHLKLSDEQKNAKELAMNSIVSVFRGKAGCSKTTLMANIALDLLIKRMVDKIIFLRPTVEAGETSLGFLPGTEDEKMAPYIRPLKEAMYALRDKEEIDGMFQKGKIEVLPVQFARGLNIRNTVVCLDEGQNASVSELQLITSRICENTKVLISMDSNQIDIKNKKISCAHKIDKLAQLNDVTIIDLKENFRHPLATLISDVLNQE